MEIILWSVILIVISLFIYFIPTIIASCRNAENTGWIFLVNLLFAGTGVGWVIALIWAIVSKKKK